MSETSRSPDLYLVSLPYDRSYGRDGQRIRHGLPPLGLASINGAVRAVGYQTRFVDLPFSDLSEGELVREIASDRPRFVGITAVTTQIISAVRVAQAIKKVAPDVTTILGGPHPTALPELTACYPGVDLVCCGEGESVMVELLDGRRYDQVEGLVWREGGVVQSSPKRPPISDLSAMPLPDYDGLCIERYHHIYLPGGVAMPVMSGRGCPFRCVFCATGAVAQRKCRYLSPSRFVDHIESLVRRFGVRNFDFVDETFILKKERALEICDEISRRGLDIRWVCQTRVNGIDEGIVRSMKRAGCKRMQIGIESGDQEILDRVGKGIRKDLVRRSCEIIRRAGVRLTGFFILGLPHETPDTMRRTIDFAKELPLDHAQFAMFIPLPGSEGWELALDGEVLRFFANNWDDFSRYTYPLVESDALSRERLKAWHSRALREYYYRPSVLVRSLLNSLSFEKLRTLLDMARAFWRIKKATGGSGDMSCAPRVLRDDLTRLIGPLVDRDSVECLDATRTTPTPDSTATAEDPDHSAAAGDTRLPVLAP